MFHPFIALKIYPLYNFAPTSGVWWLRDVRSIFEVKRFCTDRIGAERLLVLLLIRREGPDFYRSMLG